MATEPDAARADMLAGLNAAPVARGAQLRLDRVTRFGGRDLARYRMGNGLTVVTLRDTSAPVLCYQTWFRVGSSHEREGKTGLAHLFEHLMFNETESLSQGEFDRLLEAAGAEVNAATWVDWTYYYASIPREELALVVKLEADRMSNLVLRDALVVSEKEVVANERRYRVDDDVEGAVNERLYATAFEKHPYRWPTIGWMEDIQGLTPEDCRQFYATYYAPNNALVVVVGDHEEAETLALLQRYYGDLPAAELPKRVAPGEPEQHSERVVEMTRGTHTEKLQIGYLGAALGTADYDPLSVLNELLFGGRSARLHRRLVSEGELASEARASLSPFSDPGLLEFWVCMREGHGASEALEIIDQELARLGTELVSDEELDKATARLELGLLQGMETCSGKAEHIGLLEVVLGEARDVHVQLEAWRAVSAEQLRELALRLLRPERRTVILVRPQPEDGEARDGQAPDVGEGAST